MQNNSREVATNWIEEEISLQGNQDLPRILFLENKYRKYIFVENTD